MEITYPAPPWRLRGSACAAGWLIRGDAGALAAPPGWAPLRVGPWGLAGAVWADWRPGGDLAYRELAVGLVVRRGAALAVSVGPIFVDSEASQLGGHRLWAIPKSLARFCGNGESAMTAQTPLGVALLTPGRPGISLGRRTFRFATAQADHGRTVVARASLTANLRRSDDKWRLPAPLEALGRPLAAFRLEDVELRFGE